ncbi:hypothetical protein SCLCIDRAFT_904500 [Scleroderma citrinum Foug A]|uniref:Uncharacterized protein n=1 Tax=Scleroderma citrinum Foug A TaxID=1036808 RepID=A0A0C3E844_9AGAM|nr:hypothetical protein SCLCIDRAFT_904500 [Scleroderma citrinum Foug A]
MKCRSIMHCPFPVFYFSSAQSPLLGWLGRRSGTRDQKTLGLSRLRGSKEGETMGRSGREGQPITNHFLRHIPQPSRPSLNGHGDPTQPRRSACGTLSNSPVCARPTVCFISPYNFSN